MADTPNNDLEKQLRDYAQQRRDAAGTPEMHPATRAMLQAEVKQRHGGTNATASPTPRIGLARFWPRLAFAIGAVALLGIAAILLLPPDKKTKENFALAKLEEAQPVRSLTDKSDARPAAATALKPTLAPAPVARLDSVTATADSVRRSDSPVRMESAKAFKSAPARDTKTPASGSTTVATGGAAPAVGQGFFVATGDRAKELKLPTNSRVPTGQLAKSSLETDSFADYANKDLNSKAATRMAGAKKAEDFGAAPGTAGISQATFNNLGATQRYRNVAVEEKQKASIQLAVLDEFTVAQNGETLTIVDRDGSIYNGYARLAPPDQPTANAESGNPIQLVPNSGGGGRAGAVLNQGTMNRAYGQTQAPTQANAPQNFAAGQALQIQNVVEPLNYLFRVEGTNRSLNQRVVFTGNIFQNNAGYNNAGYNFVNTAPNTVQNAGNAQIFRVQQNATQGNQFNFNNGQQVPAQYNNSINGRVQLGEKKASELNAMSVDP